MIKDPEEYLLKHPLRIKKLELFLYYGKTKHFGSLNYDRITDKGLVKCIKMETFVTPDGELVDLDDVTFLQTFVKIAIYPSNLLYRLLGITTDLFVYLDASDTNLFLEQSKDFFLEDWVECIADNYTIHFEEILERSDKLFKKININLKK